MWGRNQVQRRIRKLLIHLCGRSPIQWTNRSLCVPHLHSILQRTQVRRMWLTQVLESDRKGLQGMPFRIPFQHNNLKMWSVSPKTLLQPEQWHLCSEQNLRLWGTSPEREHLSLWVWTPYALLQWSSLCFLLLTSILELRHKWVCWVPS